MLPMQCNYRGLIHAQAGRRDGVALIAQAAVAVGADGVFLEFHTDPDAALCDAPSCLPITEARPLLMRLKALREAVQS